MRNIEPGFRVVSSDGQEIGTIAICSREYCEVNTGILGLGHPLYVPMSAIAQTEGNTVYLNVPKAQIPESWSQAPTAPACPAGLYGTMPAQSATGSESTATGEATPPAPGREEAARLSPAALQAVQPGWPVICAEGKEIGKVVRARPNGLEVERGWLIFRQRLLVPAEAIRLVDEIEHKVYLDVGCAAVARFRRL